MAAVIRVLVVDDDPLVRHALRTLLESSGGIAVVAEAGDGPAAVSAAREIRPDVVLMDLHMPAGGGLEATETLLRDQPDTRVVVLTTLDDGGAVVAAMAAGARGYLLKGAPVDRLLAAVRDAADDEIVLTQEATRHLVAAATLGRTVTVPPPHPAASTPASGTASDTGTEAGPTAGPAPSGEDFPWHRLTSREQEVAGAVARGLTNAEIGALLFMGIGTVKAHVGRVLHKLGLQNRTQLALAVRESGSGSGSRAYP